jgi:hypothetical protein
MSTIPKLILFGSMAMAAVSTLALAQQEKPQMPMQDQQQMPMQQDPQQMPMQKGQQQMPMMGPGMMMGGREGMGSGMPGMMDSCPMMRMGQSKQAMMQSGMGPAMTQGAMGGTGLFGSHVTPMMNLSTEDVRAYLGMQLAHLNSKRLKVGDIKTAEGTITADIVTLDNSLVQRLKVDQHTGAIEYVN